MFRGGPEHGGIYDGPAPGGIQNVKWKFQTKAKILGSPAIANGVVYVGSADHGLYAINASDGTERWRFRSGGAVNSSPAVANGLVYFASIDGTFTAVETETGKQKWQFKTEGESRFTAPGIHGSMPRTEIMADPFDVFLSSPAVAEGVVFFGSGDHHVYALDAQTGALKWKFKTGDVVHASPAVANGVVYIGSWDRNLYALNAATGAVIWKFETGDDQEIHNQIGIASSAAVADGIVFFGCRDGHFYAVDAKTGKQKWSCDNHKGWVIASPAVRDGVVYFPTSDGRLFKALDAQSGALKFQIQNNAPSFSSPAIAGNMLYFGSHDGFVNALDIGAGKIIAQFETEGRKQFKSKYIDDKGRLSSNLYPDSTLDGMIIGMERTFQVGGVFSSPVVAGGVLYVGGGDGWLYALN
jgi:outer membrane protein assembly factor BamB